MRLRQLHYSCPPPVPTGEPRPPRHHRRPVTRSRHTALEPRTDPLTGLAARSLLRVRARQALIRAAERGWTSALFLVDVDGFHRINDQFGQQRGDEVLIETARRIRQISLADISRAELAGESDLAGESVCRPPIVARFGSDQFVIVCEHVDNSEHADMLARRVEAMLGAPPVTPRSDVVAVTASIGVALAAPGELSVDGLLRQAESALRVAKNHGPGGYSRYTNGLDTEGDAFRALRGALDDHELRLVYQPKVALDTDQIAGVEALLRWDDPDRGMIPPLEFIPLAERTGLIVPIGAWAIQEACRQARRWLLAFPERPPLIVSVNVSVRQFGPPLVGTVARALAANAVPPSSLCIEVTESVLIADMEAALETLRGLADIGVTLSIDDFGTGYSSMAYLRRLPLHELKIDKSFIDDLENDPRDTAIVAAMISTAHALDLSVVAEGVETAGQLERLRTLGCDEAQGYLFARPGEAETIVEWLQAEKIGDRRNRPAGAIAASTRANAHRPGRVLVIDDDNEVRHLATISLSALGFEVHEAANGQSGLAAARLVAPDCVLLDLVMPGLGGFDVCSALRADPATADCTILMLTAANDAGDKVAAFTCGADDYIVKPFSPRDLASRVHAALRWRREPGADSPSAGSEHR